MTSRFLVVMTVMAFMAGTAVAQQLPVGQPFEDYLRVLQLTGVAQPDPFLIRPLSVDRAAHSISQDGDHPWRGRFGLYARPDSEPTQLGLLMPEANFFWNSAFPNGQNDGAVWQGRGLTTDRYGLQYDDHY